MVLVEPARSDVSGTRRFRVPRKQGTLRESLEWRRRRARRTRGARRVWRGRGIDLATSEEGAETIVLLLRQLIFDYCYSLSTWCSLLARGSFPFSHNRHVVNSQILSA